MDLRIITYFPIELLHVDINRVYAVRAIHKQKMSEATSRETDIKTDLPSYLNSKGAHSAFQFDTAAADVRVWRFLQADIGIFAYSHAGFGRRLVIDQYISCHDERLRLLARVCESSLHEQFIQPFFRGHQWA